MSSSITLARFLLPLLGIGSILLVTKLTHPPKKVLQFALELSWIPGVLNLLADIVQERLGFWHYTASNLPFGFPFDLYVTVSLILGCTLPLMYYWLKSSRSRLVTPLLIFLPIYLLLQDYTVQKITGGAVLVWDSPYWWISDFIALATITWTTLFVFNYFTTFSEVGRDVA